MSSDHTISNGLFEVLSNDQHIIDLLEGLANCPDAGPINYTSQHVGPGSQYLDMEIHRIFRFENWDQHPGLRGYRREAWEALKPSLTLASKFLTHPDTGGYWHHLIKGIPTVDPSLDKFYLRHSPDEDESAQARADWLAVLDKLADNITFFWRPDVLPPSNRRILGICHSTMDTVVTEFDPLNAVIRGGSPWPWHACIGLNSQYVYWLLSPRFNGPPTDNDYFRYHLGVTVILLHEIAHAVYAQRACGRPELGELLFRSGRREPCAYFSHNNSELGHSLEQWLFGGKVTLSHVRGNRIKDFYLQTPCDGQMKTLNPEDFRKWFMKSSWEDINDLTIRHRFELSQGGGEFKTLPPSDENGYGNGETYHNGRALLWLSSARDLGPRHHERRHHGRRHNSNPPENQRRIRRQPGFSNLIAAEQLQQALMASIATAEAESATRAEQGLERERRDRERRQLGRGERNRNRPPAVGLTEDEQVQMGLLDSMSNGQWEQGSKLY
ncbi:hypothetical protein CC80DRAFT_553953 [Byssothecium circinans]|uniref:Uncharacterized protein n=1 Tax=Byssothecium circinans TaxID=147558 RepID=A0A6A5TEQ6_9PLEO|nr:hypothetical protein CC80DRAFT_553953 [Byssothecium circinans]